MLESLALIPALVQVALMLGDDFIESSVVECLAYVLVPCYVDDWGFVEVVPFHVVLGGDKGRVSVPVCVVPFKVFQWLTGRPAVVEKGLVFVAVWAFEEIQNCARLQVR